jgi:hypothetical protein
MKEESGKDIFIEMNRMKHMDCTQFREVLHELERPGAESDALCERALAHAESCSDCAAQLTEMESLSFWLRQLAEESAETQARPRLETLLLQEFRREKSATASRGVRWQLAAFGIAAAVLLALGLSLHRQHLVTPANLNSGQGAPQTAARVPDNSAATKTSVAWPDINPQAGANSAQVAVADDTEYATAYMPLPYAYDPSELEGGAVVRVVLPRAALVSYGLPVEGMGLRDQVTADMVISQDGTPQAIRLVAQSNANSDTDSDF